MRTTCLLLLPLCLLGCGEKQPTITNTGAEAVVRNYFDGIIHQDWPACYALLHPDTQKRLTQQQFTTYAQEYRRKLGFAPEEVHIQSCTERENDAVAHLSLSGEASKKKHTYKEGATLKRTEGSWKIVLTQAR